MPNFWLLKTEPTEYSYFNLEKDGKTVWSGVANPVALKNIRSMKKGDLAFIYHTGNEKQVVGMALIISDPYADPEKKDLKLAVVDISPERRLLHPVTLSEIKSKKEFAGFDLVRISRLSVMPVGAEIWEKITKMSEK